jgi:hypothetical protein
VEAGAGAASGGHLLMPWLHGRRQWRAPLPDGAPVCAHLQEPCGPSRPRERGVEDDGRGPGGRVAQGEGGGQMGDDDRRALKGTLGMVETVRSRMDGTYTNVWLLVDSETSVWVGQGAHNTHAKNGVPRRSVGGLG